MSAGKFAAVGRLTSLTFVLTLCLTAISTNGASAQSRPPIDRFKLPPGFKVEVWQAGLPGARTLLLGPKGTVFVGTTGAGRVYAITSQNGERQVRTVAQTLTSPNGLAMKDGALYVAAINRIYRFDDIETRLDGAQRVDISQQFNLPSDRHHGWRYTAFGPDGKLYIAVGAPCNVCEVDPNVYGNIRRYDLASGRMEVVARGVRNSVGFDWHPTTGAFWFTDNGRDNMGDDIPEDEFNWLPRGKEGANFGFPYCHANGIADPQFRKPDPCADVILPVATTGPHSASLGIKWYTGAMFPPEYRNAAFIARHGSWNRSRKFGSDLAVVQFDSAGKAIVRPFMTGLLDERRDEHLARLVGILPMPDGTLLVSDDLNGAIYRISYDAAAKGK
ncbi:MAG: hypothetical protein BGP04_25835 [Rhizobiales bacterium 62-17]|nr:PQQ-dependent sugar dehydrogenase [Hyphomicrobiales bacterium]OJY00912.1 MAG: hypothetical protein BGP04_25835 [Rhizobiales bacterium 62-17]